MPILEQRKLDYIDALRGYAIFLVIFAHVGQMYPLKYPSYLNSLIDFGPRGVQLFFIVSAFTLFLSGSKRFQTDKKPLLSFFLRRFFRIAPLYYLGIILYSSYIVNPVAATWDNILSHIFFINDLYPNESLVPGGWSISTEMLFYILVPILFVRLKNLNNAIFFTLSALTIALFYKIIIYIIALKYSIVIHKDLDFPYFFLFSVPVFGIGISFFYVIFKNDTKISPYLWFITVTLFLVGSIFDSGLINMYFQTIAFGGIAWCLSRMSSVVLVNPVIRYFGKISYSMYMTHFLVIHWIERNEILKSLLNNYSQSIIIYFLLKLIVCLALTVVISAIVYRLIEIPGQSLGKKFISNI